MRLLQFHAVSVPGLLFLILLFLVMSSYSQPLPKDFERMAGVRRIHPVTDQSDSLSAKEIVELRDSEGIPVWFSRDIFKNVCLTGECRMVRLRIYWDGAGQYLGFKNFENEPLTKTDHSVFGPEDYLKLDRILSDSLSMLKRLVVKELTIERENESKYQVDGITGATQPTIYESVVRNAVYTTFTLWHTVYGPTRAMIQTILDTTATNGSLRILFSRQNTRYLEWSIGYISRHPDHHAAFYPQIINLLRTTDYGLFQKAAGYFTLSNISDAGVQKGLALVAGDPAVLNRFEVLRRFSLLAHVSSEAILILLDHFDKQQISAGLLGYVMELVHPENLENEQVVKRLKKMTKDKNLYVRNLAEERLKSASN